jgi:hypothetical protein
VVHAFLISAVTPAGYGALMRVCQFSEQSHSHGGALCTVYFSMALSALSIALPGIAKFHVDSTYGWARDRFCIFGLVGSYVKPPPAAQQTAAPPK